MARRLEFPEVDYERDYQERPRQRSGRSVGRISTATALIALGAVAAFAAVFVFGDSIPGMRIAPVASPAEDAVAAAPVDVPEDNLIGLQAKTWGVESCLGQIVHLSQFLTQNTDSRWLAARGPTEANSELFSATIAAQETSSGLSGVSNLYAAPVGSGRCNAAYQSTIYLPQTCAQARQSIFSAFVTRIELGSNVAEAYATETGSGRVFLLAAGPTGCVAVKTENFY